MGGPNAVSMPAWLLTLPFAVAAFLSSAILIAEAPEAPSLPFILLVVPVGGQMLLGLICWLAWLTVLRPTGRSNRPVVAIMTFAVAGLVRALWVHYASVVAFGYDDPRALVRLISGTLVTVVLLAIAALIVDGYRQHQATRRSLATQLAREEEFEAQARAALQQYRAELLAGVEQSVLREVRAVMTEAGDRDAVPERLSAVTRQVLQPLTLSLRSEGEHLQVPEGRGVVTRRTVRGTVRGVLMVRPFAPGASALLAAVLFGATVTSIWGVSIAAGSLAIISVTLWIGLSAAERLIAPRLTRLPASAGVVLTLIAWISIAAAGVLLILIVYRDEAAAPPNAVPIGIITSRGLLFALAAIVAPAIAFGIARQWADDEDRLRDSVKAVARKAAAVQLEAWSERQQLGARLHGTVQAEVVAAAVRISADPEADPQPVLEDLQERISDALVHAVTTDWRTLLDDLRTVWGLSIDLTIVVSEDVAVVLDAHAPAARAVVEVIREGITNAVRAGGADRVEVAVSCDDRVIRLVIVDDGAGVSGDEARGAGSQMLDDVCLRWNRSSEGRGTTLEALVAVSDSPFRSPGGAIVRGSGVSA